MIDNTRYDALLTDALEVTESGTLTGSHVINIAEPGGIDAARLIITADAASAPLTLSVIGADAEDGEFEQVEGLSFTTEASQEFAYINRLPLHCPQYIKLRVQADSAPEAPAVVTLRVGA